jgi:hypothetical protein
MKKANLFPASILMFEVSTNHADIKRADGVCHNRQIHLASESLEGKYPLKYRASRRFINDFPF